MGRGNSSTSRVTLDALMDTRGLQAMVDHDYLEDGTHITTRLIDGIPNDRDGFPAQVSQHPDGSVTERYMNNGVIHRDGNLPAVIHQQENGRKSYLFVEHGKLSKQRWLNSIFFMSNQRSYALAHMDVTVDRAELEMRRPDPIIGSDKSASMPSLITVGAGNPTIALGCSWNTANGKPRTNGKISEVVYSKNFVGKARVLTFAKDDGLPVQFGGGKPTHFLFENEKISGFAWKGSHAWAVDRDKPLIADIRPNSDVLLTDNAVEGLYVMRLHKTKFAVIAPEFTGEMIPFSIPRPEYYRAETLFESGGITDQDLDLCLG